jgi:phosphoribosylaminoimidazolecarboxamide formyltransferase/IMP cyclohydrolase
VGSDPTQAFELALAGDPVSAFGGVIGISRPVSPALARKISGTFFEAVIAPGYAPKALEILRSKKDLRILQAAPGGGRDDLKRIAGGYLVQDLDAAQIRDVRKLPIVTKRKPGAAEYRALDFAWRMVRHVKSNAIIFTTDHQLAGVGAGQMSRVDSCRIAALKAVLPLRGTVVGSDAFFPFRDGIDQIAAAGATAVIQPGGSMRDKEAIEAADSHGLAMVFTGVRHFKH